MESKPSDLANGERSDIMESKPSDLAIGNLVTSKSKGLDSKKPKPYVQI